jgi:sRNA-binding protein
MHRMIPRGQLEELIQYLATIYPKAFFAQPHLKRPLKKNILLDLERDRVLDDDRREAAVNFYTRDWNYEQALQAGAKRIDLNGKEVGTVTELEESEAKQRVLAQKRKIKEERKLQGPIEIARSLHTAGRIPTDALSKIPAPARPPMAKAKPTPELTPNGAVLTRLRALWSNIETVLAQTEDAGLQSAVTVAALKVFVTSATQLIETLETKAEHRIPF